MKLKVYKDYFLAGAKPIVLFLCLIIFLSGQVCTCTCSNKMCSKFYELNRLCSELSKPSINRKFSDLKNFNINIGEKIYVHS